MKSLNRVSIALFAAGVVSMTSMRANAEPTRAPEPNSVSELVALAEQVKTEDPARYAVMGPEVHRIVVKDRIATAGLVGIVAGGALVAFAGQSVESDQASCDETTADSSYDRADCYHRGVDDNMKYAYLGGGLFVSGLLAYFIASPSKEEIREAARNARWTPPVTVGVSVDREGRGAVAGVSGSF